MRHTDEHRHARIDRGADERPARLLHHRQRRARLHLVVARRLRLVRDQQQLAADRGLLPDRGAGVDGGARKRPARLLRHRQRRPRLHLVVARALRLVRHQQQLAIDRRLLPCRCVRERGRANERPARPVRGRQRRPRLHLVVARRLRLVRASTTTGDRSAASSR